MDPAAVSTWEAALQSPVAVSLLLLAAVVYVEARSRKREDRYELERDKWQESLSRLAAALEAVRDTLRGR